MRARNENEEELRTTPLFSLNVRALSVPGMYLKPRTLASVVMEVSGVVIRELSVDEGKNATL